jgi:hypothetical protein
MASADPIDEFYVVPYATESEATHALRALRAFVSSPSGRVRLDGPDRVVVWRVDGTLYLSPGALSLVGYIEPDPEVSAAAPAWLAGPIMTPERSYPGPAMTPSAKIASSDLSEERVLMLGR